MDRRREGFGLRGVLLLQDVQQQERERVLTIQLLWSLNSLTRRSGATSGWERIHAHIRCTLKRFCGVSREWKLVIG